MDINITIAILSLLLTIIFGILGLWYTIKFRKKVDLTFYKDECFSLFQTVVKNFPEIEVKFNSKPISENLIFLKGTIANTGNVDIDKTNVYKPVSIELPNNCNILQAKIIDMSPNLNVNEKVNINKIQFEWDLLQNNEYFTFQSLVEYKPKDKSEKKNSKDANEKNKGDIANKLMNEIKFDYRILNLRQLNKFKDTNSDKGIEIICISIVFFLNAIVGGYIVLDTTFSPGYEMKYIINHNNNEIVADIEPDDLINFGIKVENKLIDKVKIDELNKKYHPQLTIMQKKESLLFSIYFSIISIFSFFASAYFFRTYLRKKRINSLTRRR